MAIGATTVWHLHASGSANNGAAFDPGATMGLSDLAATSATGTAPVITSATYTFVAGDVGHYIFIQSGTNWTPGWYEIASVNAGAATVTASVGSVRLYDTTNPVFPLNETAGCATVASPTSGTGGVDYSRKSDGSNKLQVTDWSCLVADDAGRLVIKSATATTSVAMVGNLVRIYAGTGWTTGYYLITACTATDRLTLERSPAGGADRTNGSITVGGSANLPSRILENGNATGDKVVAGNRVYMRGGGTDRPTVTDYTDTGYLTVAPAAQTAFCTIIGYNGRPRWENTQGLQFYSNTNLYYNLTNIYFFLRAAATYQQMVGGYYINIWNCIFDLNEVNSGGLGYSTWGLSCSIWNCEIFSADSGDSAATSQIALKAGFYNALCHGNYVHNIGGIGMQVQAATSAISTLTKNIVDNCTGVGIEVNLYNGSSAYMVRVSDNVVNDCTVGIDVQTPGSTTLFESFQCFNNLLTNCSTAGIVTDFSAADADARKGMIDYNAFYNNTTNYSGISASPNDVALTSSPYTSSTDLTLNNTAGGGADCRDAGFPQSFLGLSSTLPYTPIGILATPTAGGGILYHPGMSGGMRG